MDMNRLFDLRFVIGAFFAVAGLLIVIYGFVTDDANAQSIDRWCGAIFLVFGLLMIFLSSGKSTPAENLEDPSLSDH